MVQGNIKLKSRNGDGLKKSKNSKIKKAASRAHITPKGNPTALPKNKFREEALLDRQLSKAIDKASEQKMAAKVIQGGGKITLTDLKVKGKELSREIRRNQVKRKVTRVEEKLNELKAAAERKGEI